MAQVYTGATNRPHHRLRAHRGHVSGGARTTTRRWVGANRGAAVPIKMRVLVGPFHKTPECKDSKQAALSFEWHWKRQSGGRLKGLKGRLKALHTMLLKPEGRIGKKINLGHYTRPIRVQCDATQSYYLQSVANGNPERAAAVVMSPLAEFHWGPIQHFV